MNEVCDCEKHLKKRAECTCICDVHANFERARDLAYARYNTIVEIGGQLRLEAEQNAKLLAEIEYLESRPISAVFSPAERQLIWTALEKLEAMGLDPDEIEIKETIEGKVL